MTVLCILTLKLRFSNVQLFVNARFLVFVKSNFIDNATLWQIKRL